MAAKQQRAVQGTGTVIKALRAELEKIPAARRLAVTLGVMGQMPGLAEGYVKDHKLGSAATSAVGAPTKPAAKVTGKRIGRPPGSANKKPPSVPAQTLRSRPGRHKPKQPPQAPVAGSEAQSESPNGQISLS